MKHHGCAKFDRVGRVCAQSEVDFIKPQPSIRISTQDANPVISVVSDNKTIAKPCWIGGSKACRANNGGLLVVFWQVVIIILCRRDRFRRFKVAFCKELVVGDAGF